MVTKLKHLSILPKFIKLWDTSKSRNSFYEIQAKSCKHILMLQIMEIFHCPPFSVPIVGTCPSPSRGKIRETRSRWTWSRRSREEEVSDTSHSSVFRKWSLEMSSRWDREQDAEFLQRKIKLVNKKISNVLFTVIIIHFRSDKWGCFFSSYFKEALFLQQPIRQIRKD